MARRGPHHLPQILAITAAAALALPCPSPAQVAPAETHVTTSVLPERESRPLGTPGPRRPLESLRSGVDSASRSDQPPRSSIFDNALLRTGGSLAVVLALIYGLAHIARRVGASGSRASSLAAAFGAWGASPSPSGILDVLGRYPIGRGQALVLLKLDTRILLLGQSLPGFRLRGGGAAGGLTLLCEVTDPEQVASLLLKAQDADQAGVASKFGDLLRGFDTRHDSAGDGVVEVGRRARATRAGDSAELWDAQALNPVADVLAGSPTPTPSLRDRLGALRTRGGQTVTVNTGGRRR